MKKLASLLLAALCVCALLCACGANEAYDLNGFEDGKTVPRLTYDMIDKIVISGVTLERDQADTFINLYNDLVLRYKEGETTPDFSASVVLKDGTIIELSDNSPDELQIIIKSADGKVRSHTENGLPMKGVNPELVEYIKDFGK